MLELSFRGMQRPGFQPVWQRWNPLVFWVGHKHGESRRKSHALKWLFVTLSSALNARRGPEKRLCLETCRGI